jgi:hypothetical protein
MGWRAKLIFLLMVYFAGFASAIYCLAPAPEAGASKRSQLAEARAALKSEQWARSVNTAIHKGADLGKEAAVEVAQVIQKRLQEMQARREE